MIGEGPGLPPITDGSPKLHFVQQNSVSIQDSASVSPTTSDPGLGRRAGVDLCTPGRDAGGGEPGHHADDENKDGNCAGYIGVASDITERKEAEQALAESEERFRLAFDTAPMGMFMFYVTPEHFGRITRCNQAMADVLGHPLHGRRR